MPAGPGALPRPAPLRLKPTLACTALPAATVVNIIKVLPASAEGGVQILGQAIFDSDIREAGSTASLIRMGGALFLTTYGEINLTSVSLPSLVRWHERRKATPTRLALQPSCWWYYYCWWWEKTPSGPCPGCCLTMGPLRCVPAGGRRRPNGGGRGRARGCSAL